VHFDIKPQIVILQNNFFYFTSYKMKITASKDFGSAKKPVLPLVPEPTSVFKKEDLTQVDLFSNPLDVNSTKVKFAFKILEGETKTPREVIQAFAGLNSNTGTLRMQMMQQFACGSALSGFNSAVLTFAPAVRAQLVATATAAVAAHDGTDNARQDRLVAHRDAMTALTDDTVLGILGSGIGIIDSALQELVGILLPNKILQRVKRYLRREARKPIDMSVKSYMMHVIRINNQEIP